MIKSKKDLIYFMEQDAKMNGFADGTRADYKTTLRKFFSKRWRFLMLLRKLEYYKNTPSLFHKVLCFVYSYRLSRIGMQLGFTISPNCFGPGLSLPHSGTIVVNGNVRVGANCRLHVCTNIGASAGSASAPKIGDNVYIGPGAIIFGDIEIASNVTIGANATVNKSFSEESVVIAGTPACVVKKDSPNWLEFNGLVK